jgi:hypothetical protein
MGNRLEFFSTLSLILLVLPLLVSPLRTALWDSNHAETIAVLGTPTSGKLHRSISLANCDLESRSSLSLLIRQVQNDGYYQIPSTSQYPRITHEQPSG